VLGLKLEGVEALKKSIELCKQAGKMVTASLKKPHDLEYEKTFFPFIQLAKKRYVGNLYEDDPHHFKQKSMGIVLKRRDNAMICKDIYGGIVDIILNKMDIHEAERFFTSSVRDLLLGRVDLSKLIITKALRADYKNPESIAHKMLADRMAERDPGNKPQSNDRIPYIFIQTRAPKKGEKILQGDKVEHPDYIKANPSKCKPDFMYYLNHQIKVPCIQLFALELEKLTGYRDGWMDSSIIRKMREKNKTEMEIQEKIAALRELETERLLLGDIVRTYTNTQSGYSKDITSYFTARSVVDNTYIDEYAPKPKPSISIETMKANIQKKEIEPTPIMTKMDSVKVAKVIRNVRESAKEAKKVEKESKKTEDKSLSEVEKIAKSKIKRNNKLDIAIGSVIDL
jgi:DNA polymerase elongation subunit (family B)